MRMNDLTVVDSIYLDAQQKEDALTEAVKLVIGQ